MRQNRTSLLGSLLVACALLLLAGCVGEPEPASPPELNRAAFDASIYPILLRDCAFSGCHGDSGRFFRVHGPNRTRYDEDTLLSDPTTEREYQLAFDRARSMLAMASTPEQSLLVRKPLELDQGGAPHMGVDINGRDVYPDRDEPRWQAIRDWAQGGF